MNNSVHKVTLELRFPERRAEDLAAVNRMRAAMPLSELEIADFDGYLCTNRRFAPEGREIGVEYRYGFDKLVLRGEADGDENIYQIDTQVVVNSIDSDRFHDLWCEEHPDRVMRALHLIRFKDKLAYVVLHHERGQLLLNG